MFDIKENLKKLPDKPGVYLHKDKIGQVIYVGKAISLKNRVRQYFQSPARLDPRIRAMVSHIEEFEYITTDSEMEALILECNLIKKYMPKYNVLLRDDKTFPYIKVTLNEEFPRILKTRKIYHDGAKYFGPYTDAGAVTQIIELLNNIYSLKRCAAKSFPSNFRPCLNYHIGQCKGNCIGKVSHDEYRKTIGDVLEFLQGKNKKVLEYLNSQMAAEAEAMNFERAAEYRDYISAVNAVAEKQKVVLSAESDIDVILTAKGLEGAHVILFFVRQGKLSGRESFYFEGMQEEAPAEVVTAFIKQYYSGMTIVPKEVMLDSPLPDQQLLEEWLTDLRGSLVRIITPQKGEKKAFLEMTKRDVIEMMKVLDERAKNQKEKTDAISEALTALIYPEELQAKANGSGAAADGKTSSPKRRWRLEAYDISNTNGVDSVGAMVVFEDGKPKRKDYRRFKIKTIEGPNDYGSLQEVLYRRFRRAQAGDPSFAEMPDLLLMDGGENQVNVVQQVLDAMKIDIPVAGMVKDDKHRTRGLIFHGRELVLREHPVLFKYMGTIQEEVHRFAIDYHRGLRGKALRKSALDDVDGIGEKRKMALLSHFGSIDKIRAATVEELAEVQGMNLAAAEKVKEAFRPIAPTNSERK